jgi:hypothetical protein
LQRQSCQLQTGQYEQRNVTEKLYIAISKIPDSEVPFRSQQKTETIERSRCGRTIDKKIVKKASSEQ